MGILDSVDGVTNDRLAIHRMLPSTGIPKMGASRNFIFDGDLLSVINTAYDQNLRYRCSVMELTGEASLFASNPDPKDLTRGRGGS